MIQNLLTLFLSLFCIPCFTQFTKVVGPITTTLSDSRSVNFIDLNNDDWDDVFISNGKSGGQKDLLYLNDQSGQFIQITDMDLVNQSKPSDGASFADYNQDGFIDAIVSNWYGYMDDLFLNDGNGKLMLNNNAGIAPSSYAETAVFCDYNNDGLLDIYVTTSGGTKINHLYKNLGNNKFERITSNKILEGAKASRAAIWSDLNNDGHLDLVVTNEGTSTNDIFMGFGGDVFQRYNASNILSKAESSITASVGDIDNDGDMDMFIGNSGYFKPLKGSLYKNENGVFQLDNSNALSLNERCTFGSSFSDYDNDGFLDLLLSNGFCNNNMKDQLFKNNGDGSFTEVSHLMPTDNVCSYGCAWGDANNDGFLDIAIANCKNNDADIENPNTLLLNTPNGNHWVKIKLVGVENNTNGIGARITVKAKIGSVEMTQIREISGQSGYSGQNSLIAHFGLKDASIADSVIVRWPNGKIQILTNLDINKLHTIVENTTSSTSDQPVSSGITMTVLPNPAMADSQLEVQIKVNDQQQGQLMICNESGQLVSQKQIKVAVGINHEMINEILKPGLYLIIFKSEYHTTVKKVLITL